MKRLIERYGRLSVEQLNEANTRLLLIDEVLEHVLGWPRETFNPEEYAAAVDEDHKGKRQWLDYHLKTGEGMTLRLVVEAKRAGKAFELSLSKPQPVLPLKQLRQNHGPVLGSAIAQALKYCGEVGTHCFVVTNGAQWIASLVFAHNVAASELSAVVFSSLEDIAARLPEFIDLLSPAGLASQVLLTRAIAGGTRVPLFCS